MSSSFCYARSHSSNLSTNPTSYQCEALRNHSALDGDTDTTFQPLWQAGAAEL